MFCFFRYLHLNVSILSVSRITEWGINKKQGLKYCLFKFSLCMKKITVKTVLLILWINASSQFVHKIKADSVLITNDSCNAELNLENSTKHINGFLYNKGHGRTEFRKGLVKINDSLYIIGGDTLEFGSALLLWTKSGNNINNTNLGKVTIGNTISSPGSGTASERFGDLASVGSNNYSTAIGNWAQTFGNETVAVGYNARAAFKSTAIGNNAQATGTFSVLVGVSLTDGGSNNRTAIGTNITSIGHFSGGSGLSGGMINIGYNNSASTCTGTLLLGANLTNDRNSQVVIGNGLAGGFLLDMVLGGSLSNSVAANYGPFVLRTTDGSGSNSAGMPISIRAGKSTGSANGGYISFFTTPAGTSGSSVNTEAERIRISNTGSVGIGLTNPSAILHLTSGTSSANTAPLKFTAGSNLSTPENGAVEYDGTNYFATSGGTRYVLTRTLTATTSLDFPNTSSQDYSDLTITVTGAANGDAVSLGVPNGVIHGMTNYSAWVSATDTVTVRFTNYSGGSINPASSSFRIAVIKY